MFSHGALGTRVTANERHFFMTDHVSNQYCVEFADPGTYSSSLTSSTPKGRLVKLWGDIYKDKLNIANDNGIIAEAPYVEGYFWDGEKLWWQIARRYNGSSAFNDPSIGCSILNNDGSSTAYGKWRLGPLGSYRYCNFITDIPSAFVSANTPGKYYAIGANEHSGYQSTPYGPNLNAFSLPSLSTPADVYVGKTGSFSVPTIPLVGYDINHRFTVSGRKYRRSEGPYGCGPYPLADSGSYEVASYWAEQLDETATCSWIDLPDKYGVVWFGQLCDVKPGYSAPNDPLGLPHYGYGDPDGPRYGQGRPANYCCHGQDDPSWGATGPFCHSTIPWVFIMDPARFIPVIKGSQQPWEAAPDLAFRLNNIIELSSHPSGRVSRLLFGGSVFDAARRLLFVSVKGIDSFSTYYPRPAILVFRII
jgi:hypothetical protein